MEDSLEKTDIESTFACKDCNSTFGEASEYHDHSCNFSDKIDSPKKSKRNGNFNCEKCGKAYKYKRFLDMHLQYHIKTSDFTCNLCQKQYKSAIRLQSHQQSHKARYVCHVCNKAFGETGNLKKHVRIHSGERPFVCEVCNKGFTQKRHLQDHKCVHDKEPDENACSVCGITFLTKQTLEVHQKCHVSNVSVDGKDCMSLEDSNYIQGNSCQTPECGAFHCNVCGKPFKRHYDLRDHLTIHTNEQPYSCEICNRRFHKYVILKMHMESHTSERKHVCHLCSKAFKTFSVLRKHCLLHTGERNKICKICKKTFKCNNTLRAHYLTHSDERPYSCETCGKCFKRITPLQNHLGTHTGELPFPCEVCGQRFARKITLQNHFILHTGQRPYVCPICKKGFSRKSSLKLHDSTVHTKIATKKLDSKAQHMLEGDIIRNAILSAQLVVIENKTVNDNAVTNERVAKISAINWENSTDNAEILFSTNPSIEKNGSNISSGEMDLKISENVVSNQKNENVSEEFAT